MNFVLEMLERTFRYCLARVIKLRNEFASAGVKIQQSSFAAFHFD